MRRQGWPWPSRLSSLADPPAPAAAPAPAADANILSEVEALKSSGMGVCGDRSNGRTAVAPLPAPAVSGGGRFFACVVLAGVDGGGVGVQWWSG
jgi:hypothetical protein